MISHMVPMFSHLSFLIPRSHEKRPQLSPGKNKKKKNSGILFSPLFTACHHHNDPVLDPSRC